MFQFKLRWLAVFTFLLVMATSVQAQEEILSDQEQSEKHRLARLSELVADEVKEVIKRRVTAEYGLVMDQQVQFFDLDESTKRKLSFLVKRQGGVFVNKNKKRIDTSLTNALNRQKNEVIYIVNGKKIKLPRRKESLLTPDSDRDKEEEENVLEEVEMNIFASSSSYLSLVTKTGNRSSWSSLVRISGLDTIRDPQWLKVIEDNSEKSMSDYEKFLDESSSRDLLDYMMVDLTLQLGLSDAQQKSIRQWMSGEVKTVRSQAISSDASSNLTRICKKTPPGLSENQKIAWRGMGGR